MRMWGVDIRVGALVEIILSEDSLRSLGLVLSQDETYGFMWNVLVFDKKIPVHSSRMRRV